MTYSLCNPLGWPKRLPYWPAYRRGSPSKIEGLGSLIKGVWGKVSPAGLDRVQGFIFAMLKHGLAKPTGLAEHVQMKFGITC
ncbi:hypothetical protein BVH75_29485 (plasmid) [Bacillus thuringiensis]|nr:hypothetical protein BJG91_02050 [Bacillus thuringiensis]ARX70088.1 hypothetical protein BVH75_29485 [Bacillus thuringiensis]